MSAATAATTMPDFTTTLVIQPHPQPDDGDEAMAEIDNLITMPRRRFKPSAARPQCFYRTGTGHCTNQTHWLIDGKAHCKRHFDQFWDTHFVEDHRVVRLDQGEGF